MHTSDPSAFDPPTSGAARPDTSSADSSASHTSSSAPAGAVLREARRLHRAATSDALATSLPVLRRLIASGAMKLSGGAEMMKNWTDIGFPAGSLTPVGAVEITIAIMTLIPQRMLAREAGFDSWESWRPALGTARASTLMQAHELRRDTGTLHLWFRNEAEARAFATLHGGTAVRLGEHAVVAPGP